MRVSMRVHDFGLGDRGVRGKIGGWAAEPLASSSHKTGDRNSYTTPRTAPSLCPCLLLAASVWFRACARTLDPSPPRIIQWDAPTLSVLSDAGFDCSALPRLADIGDLRAGVSGSALKRWPELEGASIRLGLGDGAAASLGSGCVPICSIHRTRAARFFYRAQLCVRS